VELDLFVELLNMAVFTVALLLPLFLELMSLAGVVLAPLMIPVPSLPMRGIMEFLCLIELFSRGALVLVIRSGILPLLVLSLNLARQLMGKFIVFVILNVPVLLVKLVVPLGWIWILI
jgi:hypothetical protein